MRVLRPFVSLGFMMMSLLCCLARYGLHYNHWTDVVVGFVAGLLLAVYIVSSSTLLIHTVLASFHSVLFLLQSAPRNGRKATWEYLPLS